MDIPPANNRLPLPEDMSTDLPPPTDNTAAAMIHPETQFDIGLKPASSTDAAFVEPIPLDNTVNDVVIDDIQDLPDDSEVVFDTALGGDGIPTATDAGPVIKFPGELPAVLPATTTTENDETPSTTEPDVTTTGPSEPEVTTVEATTVDEATQQPTTTEQVTEVEETTTVEPTTEVVEPVTEVVTDAPVEQVTTEEPTVTTQLVTEATTEAPVEEITTPGKLEYFFSD